MAVSADTWKTKARKQASPLSISLKGKKWLTTGGFQAVF
jgi:hypothetical protein